jgi:GTP cyclohydrolase I
MEKEGFSDIKKGMSFIFQGLKKEFGLDLDNENFKDTPKRVAKSFYEIFSGINCDEEIKEILNTSFPSDYDGMIVANNIHCFSMCPHHFLPVEYIVNLAYIPEERVLGISKLSRIVELLAKQPLLQEDYTKKILSCLEEYINPQGSIVQVKGRHFCMTMRGIKQDNSWTLTSSVQGSFKENPETRKEFFDMIGTV